MANCTFQPWFPMIVTTRRVESTTTSIPPSTCHAFHISTSQNKLLAVGCDTVGLIGSMNVQKEDITTGCISLCRRDDEFFKNDSCNCIGSCQASIPLGLSSSELGSTSVFNHTLVHDYNPCGYAFLAENGAYKFMPTDLMSFPKKTFAAVLD